MNWRHWQHTTNHRTPTTVWLERVDDWRSTVYVMETQGHRTSQAREPRAVDIKRHRAGRNHGA